MTDKLTRRQFLRVALARALAAPAVALLVSSYPLVLEPVWLDITRLRLRMSGLPPALRGLRIVQFSDVHIGPFSHGWFLERAMQALQRTRPDLIVFTGDMITRDAPLTPEALQPFKGLQAPLGVWGVLGNHDHWTDPDRVQHLIEQHTPIRVLRNAAVSLTYRGYTLWVVGVDDAWVGADDVDRAFQGVPTDTFRLVLMHEPDAADWLPLTPRTVQLSGHSHGGQVRLPFLGPLMLPYLGRKYDMGLYNVRGAWVYTNRGLGVIAPPIRLNCRPEITVIDLDVEVPG